MAVVAAEMADTKKSEAWGEINRRVATRLAAHEWTAAKDNALRLYLERVLASKSRDQHLAWILELGKLWAEKETKESSAVCEILYPALSQAWENREHLPLTPEQVQKETLAIVDHYLEEVMQFETFCGYSILQLEYRVLKDDPAQMARRLLTRDYVAINVTTASLFWALSEDLSAVGETGLARKIWEHLGAKGGDDIIEVKYAKNRLSKSKTEVEDLWKK